MVKKKRTYKRTVKAEETIKPVELEIEALKPVTSEPVIEPHIEPVGVEVCVKCEFHNVDGKCVCPYGNFGKGIKNPRLEGCFKYYPKKTIMED